MIILNILDLISSCISRQRKKPYSYLVKINVMFSNSENKNGSDYIDKVKEKLFENLRSLPHAPSVQMHDRAPDGITVKDVPKGTSEGNPDVR